MKKLYTFLMYFLPAFSVLAQHPASDRETSSHKSASTVVTIGNTTYDLQTNASPCNRLSFENGKMSATWNSSFQLNPLFPDRGIGYNTYDGNSWSTVPVINIDSCAWPNIDISGDVEYIIAHNRNPTMDDLVLMKRSPVGTGSWQKNFMPLDTSGHLHLWPKMKVGGNNDSTIHVIALSRPIGSLGMLNNGIDGALKYSRSLDGGTTWDQLHVFLPGIDSINYKAMAPETYAIDVKGNTVAIVQGSIYNDWVLWKSIDNGTTWFRQVIKPYPIQGYDYNTMITDIDMDGVADTIDAADGSHAVLIDNNGMVHCWVGMMRLLQDTPGAMGFYPFTDGLMYWNESFMTNPPVQIAGMEDVDTNGVITPGPQAALYNTMSLTSMPSAGIDGAQGIFFAYSSVVENTDDGSGQSYRNIYCKRSYNNGADWSESFRINASDFDEQVFPSIPENIDTMLRVIWQQDGLAGTNQLDSDPIGSNEILYFEDDTASIFTGLSVNPLYFKEVTGIVFMDINQNKVFDGTDVVMENQIISLPTNQVATNTDINGQYRFLLSEGIFTIDYDVPANWYLTTDSASYTVNITNSGISGLSFGIFTSSLYTETAIGISTSIPRCNNYMTAWINASNSGCQPIHGYVKYVKDSLLDFLQATPASNAFNADTFFWDMGIIYPFQNKVITINLSTLGVGGGINLTHCAYLFMDSGYVSIADDFCLNQMTSCSYDPNDKSVLPEGIGNQHYTLIEDSLFYTIRFQNTGNDTAFTVRIRDTLDPFIDPASFSLIASSHPVTYTMKNDNSIIFEFENILLPDSNVNAQGSNGFVKYRVQALNSIPEGTVVENTAYIYFDYNPPIQTNTTENTMVSVIGLAENSTQGFKIYPNPSMGEVTIEFDNAEGDKFTIDVTDISGKKLLSLNNLNGDIAKINIDYLAEGLYFIRINKNDRIVGISKLVKN